MHIHRDYKLEIMIIVASTFKILGFNRFEDKHIKLI